MGAAAWMYQLYQTSTQKVRSLEKNLQDIQTEIKNTSEKEKKQLKELQEKRDEVRTLKNDIALLKKKAHTSQEEHKKQHVELKEHIKTLESQVQAKPAFAEEARPEPKVVIVQAEAPKPAPAPEPVVVHVPVRVPSPSEEALKLQIKTLEDALNTLRAQYERENHTLQMAKQDVQKLRRRSEDLRRIDIINRGKTHLLEDKLKTLGRAYYEAISEVALLKGQVQPPRPKGIPLEKTPTPAEDREAEAQALAEAHDENLPEQASA
jgi:myosin heavy subunit